MGAAVSGCYWRIRCGPGELGSSVVEACEGDSCWEGEDGVPQAGGGSPVLFGQVSRRRPKEKRLDGQKGGGGFSLVLGGRCREDEMAKGRIERGDRF